MYQDLAILYVEDDPRSRKVMQMIASDIGLSNLIIFEDSTDFKVKVTALDPKPDLIFLDIHMSPHSGFEMLEILRQSKQFDGVPIVAMTASVMNEEVHRLRTCGFDGCLAKPIDFDTFPEALQRILSGEKIWRIVS
jgi:CheY-like chemotaxis protein